MRMLPRDLANGMANPEPQVFTLTLEAARRKAREIIDQAPAHGLTPAVEKWRQLPDGQIELSIRHFSAEDEGVHVGCAAVPGRGSLGKR